MLEYLRDKKDVGFFLSVQALMQTCWSVDDYYKCMNLKSGKRKSKTVYVLLCSVLDLNAFERQNKAEGLGMVSEEGTSKSQYSYSRKNITLQPLFTILSSNRLSASFEGTDYIVEYTYLDHLNT